MESSPLLPRLMQLEEFLPFVGRALTADCDPRSVELVLVEATPLRHPGLEGRTAFILIFRSAPSALLLPGSYILSAPGFSRAIVDLLQIAPPAGASGGHYYQAVFN